MEKAFTTLKDALKGLFLPELLIDEGWEAYIDLLLRNISYADLQLLRTDGFPYSFDFPAYIYTDDIFTVDAEKGTITYDPAAARYNLDFAPIDVVPENIVEITVGAGSETRTVWSAVSPTPYFTFDPASVTTFIVTPETLEARNFGLRPYRLPEQLDPAAINEAVFEQAAFLDPNTPPTSPQALFGLIARLLRARHFAVWYQFANGGSYARKTFADYVKYHRVEEEAMTEDRPAALSMWTDAPVPLDPLRDRFGTGTALSRIIGYDKQFLVVENNAPAPNYIPLIADYVPNLLTGIAVNPSDIRLPQRSGKWRFTTPSFQITAAKYDVFTRLLTFNVEVGCAPSQASAIDQYRLWISVGDTFVEGVNTAWVSGQTSISGEFVVQTPQTLTEGSPVRIECALLPPEGDSYWYASEIVSADAAVTLVFAEITLAQTSVETVDAQAWATTIEWNTAGEFTSFVVQYRPSSATEWVTLSPTTARNATIALTQLEEYTFQVRGTKSGYPDVLSNEVVVVPPTATSPIPDVVWEFEADTWEQRTYPQTRLTITAPADPSLADRTYTVSMNGGVKRQYPAGVISPYEAAAVEPLPGILFNEVQVVGNALGLYGASQPARAVLSVRQLTMPQVSYNAATRLLSYNTPNAQRYTLVVNGTTVEDTAGTGQYEVPEFEGLLTVTVVAHALYYLTSPVATLADQSSAMLPPAVSWIYNGAASNTTLTITAPSGVVDPTFEYRWGQQTETGITWRTNYTAIAAGAHPDLVVVPPTEEGVWVVEVITVGQQGQKDSIPVQRVLTSAFPSAVQLTAFDVDYTAKTIAVTWVPQPDIDAYELAIVGMEGVVSDFIASPDAVELGQRAASTTVRLTAIGLYRGNFDITPYENPITVIANPINDVAVVYDTQYNIAIPANYWGAEISIFAKPIAGRAISDYEYLCAVEGQGTEIVGRTLIVDELARMGARSGGGPLVALRMARRARIAAVPEAPLVAAPAAGSVSVVTTPRAKFDIRPMQVVDSAERFVLLAEDGEPYMLYAPESTIPLPVFGITKIYEQLSLLTDGIFSAVHLDIQGTEDDIRPEVVQALQEALRQGVKPGVNVVVSYSYPNVDDSIDITDSVEQATTIIAEPDKIQLNQRGTDVATVQLMVMPAGRPINVKIE